MPPQSRGQLSSTPTTIPFLSSSLLVASVPASLVSPSTLTPFHGSLAPWCLHSLHPLNIHDPSLGSLPWNVRSSCYPFTCFCPVSPRSVLRPHTCAFQAHVAVEEHNCAVSPSTSILIPTMPPLWALQRATVPQASCSPTFLDDYFTPSPSSSSPHTPPPTLCQLYSQLMVMLLILLIRRSWKRTKTTFHYHVYPPFYVCVQSLTPIILDKVFLLLEKIKSALTL